MSDSDSDKTIEPSDYCPSSPDLFHDTVDDEIRNKKKKVFVVKERSVHQISDSDSEDGGCSSSLRFDKKADDKSKLTEHVQTMVGDVSKQSVSDNSLKVKHESQIKILTSNLSTDYSNKEHASSTNKHIKDKSKSRPSNTSPSLKRKRSSDELSDVHQKYKLDLSRQDTLPVADVKEDARPLCKYGDTCYRKNSSHLKEFRHTGQGVKQRSASPKTSNASTSDPSSYKRQRLDKLPSIGIIESTNHQKHSKTAGMPKSPTATTSGATSSHLKHSQKAGMPKSPTATTSGSNQKHSQKAGMPKSPSATTSSADRQDSQSTIIPHYNSAADVVKASQPLGFLLTKVDGIPKQYNTSLAMSLKDILSPSMGNLVASLQFNYVFDIPWLIQQYPPEFRSKPLTVVFGDDRHIKTEMRLARDKYTHIKLVPARLEIPWGTHHTKMMILLYDTGLRVVIHTANLVPSDWHQKSQGIWISRLFSKLSVSFSGASNSVVGDSPTNFKCDLLEYLSAYRHFPAEWIKHIQDHDMSKARVFLIGSVPGRHTGEKKSSWGHLKLRKVLQSHGPETLPGKELFPNVVGQFSSIGSLGPNKESWVFGEWLCSLAATKGKTSMLSSLPRIRFIYPSKDNVRLSLEGFMAGGSLPYSIKVAKKQEYIHSYFHQWKSSGRGRSHASPHIKTYLRASDDWQKLAWFLVTSANLSKAAWGVLEKTGSQLMIRSYEIGVLFLPQHFTSEGIFEASSTASMGQCEKQGTVFSLPYDLPPTPYSATDRPWIWDIQYKDLPDSHGNMWCPS